MDLGGTLPSSGLAGMLLPAVPAGIPFPVGPAGPVDLDATLSPANNVSGVLWDPGGMLPASDLAGMLLPAIPAGIPFSVGPVGSVDLCGTLSPSDSDPAGPDGPYVAGGPVGPFGTLSLSASGSAILVDPGGTLYSPALAVPAGILLSPSASESVILVDPGGMFPSSDLARMRGPAPLAGLAVLMGPVGPAMSLGVLPLSDSESAEPVMPSRIQYSYIVVWALGTVETLLPGEHGPGLCPIGLTVGLLPAVRDPMIALSPVEGLERDCAEVGEESNTVHGGWSGPDIARTPAVVAMVEMDALLMLMGNDAPLDCVDGCPAWDGGCQREMVDGVTICCGNDWCDSAFRQGLGSFHSGADDPLPMVVCNENLFSDDVSAALSVSVREEVPVLTLQILTDKGVPLVTPVVDQDVRQIKDELCSQDDRTDGVSGLSFPICGLLLHRGVVGLDGQDLDHWRGVVWDPGIVCLQCWLVCSDCHVWAEWSF